MSQSPKIASRNMALYHKISPTTNLNNIRDRVNQIYEKTLTEKKSSNKLVNLKTKLGISSPTLTEGSPVHSSVLMQKVEGIIKRDTRASLEHTYGPKLDNFLPKKCLKQSLRLNEIPDDAREVRADYHPASYKVNQILEKLVDYHWSGKYSSPQSKNITSHILNYIKEQPRSLQEELLNEVSKQTTPSLISANYIANFGKQKPNKKFASYGSMRRCTLRLTEDTLYENPFLGPGNNGKIYISSKNIKSEKLPGLWAKKGNKRVNGVELGSSPKHHMKGTKSMMYLPKIEDKEPGYNSSNVPSANQSPKSSVILPTSDIPNNNNSLSSSVLNKEQEFNSFLEDCEQVTANVKEDTMRIKYHVRKGVLKARYNIRKINQICKNSKRLDTNMKQLIIQKKEKDRIEKELREKEEIERLAMGNWGGKSNQK